MAGDVSGVIGLRCLLCGHRMPDQLGAYVCDRCGGNLQVLYDYAVVKEHLTRESLRGNPQADLWRYAPLLPISPQAPRPSLAIGWTPLYKAQRLGGELGCRHLYLKDEGRNPSGSLKDRASAVAMARAVVEEATAVTAASTGNAGSSMACLAADMGMPCTIFVPRQVPEAKLAQLLIFGARVVAVEGSYDDAYDLCLSASERFGWYNRNTGHNPFTREGKKTCAMEICEQLHWEVPDWVVVSMGDGNIISGLWKGFCDFHQCDLIDHLPRLAGVQSVGSNAIVRGVQMLEERSLTSCADIVIQPVEANTIADSISVNLPRDGVSAVAAILESGGAAVEVRDEDILTAVRDVARSSGVFAEPAGAAGVAGLRSLIEDGVVRGEDRVVCVITGNGLKDVKSALRITGTPHIVGPDIDEVSRVLGPSG